MGDQPQTGAGFIRQLPKLRVEGEAPAFPVHLLVFRDTAHQDLERELTVRCAELPKTNGRVLLAEGDIRVVRGLRYWVFGSPDPNEAPYLMPVAILTPRTADEE